MTALAKFSKITGGVYPLNTYEEFPPDALDIPDALYAQFRNGEVSQLTVVNGQVVAYVDEPVDPRLSMVVTTFQAHAAIARAGLYESVEALMVDPETPFEVRLAWTKAQHFSRLSPTVVAMGAALGLTDVQLDELFAVAATIEA